MSSTESLRRDHNLIEKMLRALTVTAGLLESGKSVPPAILEQSIEFTKDFLLVCHHGKEEGTLFPTLERHGMPRQGGPIARMLLEHGIAKELANKMEVSARKYLQTNDFADLVADIKSYVDHVSLHLTKENSRLFEIAEMVLRGQAGEIDKELAASEQARFSELGKDRQHYERMVSDVESQVGSGQ